MQLGYPHFFFLCSEVGGMRVLRSEADQFDQERNKTTCMLSSVFLCHDKDINPAPITNKKASKTSVKL